MKIKGFFHIHSAYSADAKVSLAQLREIFSKKGCDFIIVTEHFEHLTPEGGGDFISQCQQMSSNNFLLIPGFEIDCLGQHILAIGVSQYYSNQDYCLSLEKYKNDGTLIILAHPYYRILYRRSAEAEVLLDGCEIWNAAYDGKICPRPSSIALLQRLRMNNAHIWAYAGLDMHRAYQDNGPSLVVDAEGLSVREILRALKKGSYYIQKGNLRIGANGKISRRQKVVFGFISFFSVNVLRILKIFSFILRGLGIKPPEKAKELIRKII